MTDGENMCAPVAPVMTDKEFFLDFHNLSGEEGEEVWARKVKMDQGAFKAPMAFIGRDICYDSPIDGRHITTKQARQEDLARSGCMEYDPGMKQDYQERLKAKDAALDKSVDATVEKAVHTMPARSREKLVSELQGGLVAEPVRITPPQTSAR